jgi:hypothetical protein
MMVVLISIGPTLDFSIKKRKEWGLFPEFFF